MRVLIVGCGYAGLPLGAELARAGHQVLGIRRNPAAAVELKAAGIEPLFIDVTKSEDLARLPRPFDWVINTVASSVGAGVEDYRRVYLQGTTNLLAWLRENPPNKYVYTSSTGVYGQDDGGWVDETGPTEPESPTARVLVETEKLLLRAVRDFGFPAVILRLAGIYGPGRGYWMRQFLEGTARIPGDGSRWVNMVHQLDVAGAIRAVLERGGVGEIYNVVDDEPVTHFEMFQWLAGRLQRSLPLFANEDAAVQRKRGATNKRVSNRKLKAELDHQFQFPNFREGFAAELTSHPAA